MSDDQLKALRQRQLTKWMLHAGSNVWAAYGDTKWSAIVVLDVGRVWGRGRVVNPRTGETKKDGRKFHLGRCLKRDPKKKGSDKPGLPPSKVFAQVKEQERREKEIKREQSMAPRASSLPRARTPAEEAAAAERVKRLIERFHGEDDVADDW